MEQNWKQNVAVSVPQQPPSAAMTAAQLWAESRDRLNRAISDHHQAVAALDAARQEESAAWEKLQDAAERGPPKPTQALGGVASNRPVY